MKITKKELKTSVKKINKIIVGINEENIFEEAISFFKEIMFLGNNRGAIHAEMPRRGRFLWFFVSDKTYKKQCYFLKNLREIEEIPTLKIKREEKITKNSILWEGESLSQIEKEKKEEKIYSLLQLIKSYEGKFILDWLW